MPWLKAGDNAATHPVVLRVSAIGGDANQVFGFVMRCALQSAGHTTDYVIDLGTAALIGGPDTDRLAKMAVRAGYFKPCRHDGMKAWRLIDDPDFLHMRLRSELDWERQQRADSANTALTGPVRLRDGDGCRYCGVIVSWTARKGARRGSYDHRIPGQAATVDTLVVACGQCNSGRRDDPDSDQRYPLRPVPLDPYYSPRTAEFLESQGFSVVPANQRPGITPDTAVPATQQPAGPRVSDPSNGTPRRDSHGPADFSGSSAHLPGRVGTGRAGTALGTGAGPPPARRKRSARGRPR